jgi:hypothetical protein
MQVWRAWQKICDDALHAFFREVSPMQLTRHLDANATAVR